MAEDKKKIEDKKDSETPKKNILFKFRKLIRKLEKDPNIEKITEDEEVKNVLKFIPKGKLIRIGLLSIFKGIAEGFAAPWFTKQMINWSKVSEFEINDLNSFLTAIGVTGARTINNGIQLSKENSEKETGSVNDAVGLNGGLKYAFSILPSILSSRIEQLVNETNNEISTKIKKFSNKKFMRSDYNTDASEYSVESKIAIKAAQDLITSSGAMVEGALADISAGIHIVPELGLLKGGLIMLGTLLISGTTLIPVSYIERFKKNRKKAEKSEEAQIEADKRARNLIYMSGQTEKAIKRQEKLISETAEAAKKIDKKIFLLNIWRIFANTISTAVSFVVFFKSAQYTGESFANFMAKQQAMEAFIKNADKFFRGLLKFHLAWEDCKNAIDALNKKQKTVEKNGAIDLSLENYDEKSSIIKFNNVSYSHKIKHINEKDNSETIENLEILKNVNFDIKSGEKVAILGPSGVGKTTLVDLLTRCYDLEENSGTIEIGGKNIKDLKLSSLRKNICSTPSDGRRFYSGSLKANLLLDMNIDIENKIEEKKNKDKFEIGIDNLENKKTDEKILNVLESLNLPASLNVNGKIDIYDKSFGVRNFSTGQTSRLEVARRILSKAPILIYDEPTTGLGGDYKTKAKTLDAIIKNSENKTSIVITHEVEDVAFKFADKILVLKDKNIVSFTAEKNGFSDEQKKEIHALLDSETEENDMQQIIKAKTDSRE